MCRACRIFFVVWQHAETKISAGPSRITQPAELNEVVVVMVQYYSNTFLTPKNINTFQIISEHFLRSARSVFGFRTNRDGQDGRDGRGISNTQTSSTVVPIKVPPAFLNLVISEQVARLSSVYLSIGWG